MLFRKRDLPLIAVILYWPYMLGAGAVIGGATYWAHKTQPAAPDAAVTIRIPAEDLAKIQGRTISDAELGKAFRDAVEQRNSQIPPKLELPKTGPSGSAPPAP